MRLHHRAYDRGALDLLPYLEPAWRAQLPHAVGHAGLTGRCGESAGGRASTRMTSDVRAVRSRVGFTSICDEAGERDADGLAWHLARLYIKSLAYLQVAGASDFCIGADASLAAEGT